MFDCLNRFLLILLWLSKTSCVLILKIILNRHLCIKNKAQFLSNQINSQIFSEMPLALNAYWNYHHRFQVKLLYMITCISELELLSLLFPVSIQSNSVYMTLWMMMNCLPPIEQVDERTSSRERNRSHKKASIAESNEGCEEP